MSSQHHRVNLTVVNTFHFYAVKIQLPDCIDSLMSLDVMHSKIKMQTFNVRSKTDGKPAHSTAGRPTELQWITEKLKENH